MEKNTPECWRTQNGEVLGREGLVWSTYWRLGESQKPGTMHELRTFRSALLTIRQQTDTWSDTLRENRQNRQKLNDWCRGAHWGRPSCESVVRLRPRIGRCGYSDDSVVVRGKPNCQLSVSIFKASQWFCVGAAQDRKNIFGLFWNLADTHAWTLQ